MIKHYKKWPVIVSSLAMVACSSSDDNVVVEGDFKIAYVQRSVEAVGNPTDAAQFEAGGDLYILDLASPSAAPTNVTGGTTQGAGDVSDPEVSYDGTKVLFSMKLSNASDTSWNVWEYDIDSQNLSRIISDDSESSKGDDVDPAYLPDGRIIFSSNRQQKSQALRAAKNIEPYPHLDEYERERAIVLHVMNNDGTDIHQISSNQSHDRNPTVLSTGEVMFARWDHVAGRNHFPMFFTNPDGTNMFVQYGAFSPGNSFLHPREMEDGRIMTSLMPLSGTREGGALMAVDVKNFSDNNEPVDPSITGQGQVQLTEQTIEIGRGVSEFGRYTTPYPLWDGTNRALVSYSPLNPTTETNLATGEEEDAEGPPTYGIYMFDVGSRSLRPIKLPPIDSGLALTDPVAIIARPAPSVIPDKPLDAGLIAEGMAVLNVKSVYDTDSQDLMGDRVLIPGEGLPDAAQPLDLAKMKDPAQTTAAQRPARFVRVTKAVGTPQGLSRESIGETMFEMQQIVGYAPIDPDGSFKIKVPADESIGVTVVDSEGRALQTHTNWINIRPGETRTCNGCHSPRRGSALNSAPIAGDHPNTVASMVPESGESMAETRTRLSPAELSLSADLVYTDVWTDATAAGRAPDADLIIDYSGLGGPAPVDGLINYATHVQAIWDAKCVSCHNNSDPADVNSAGLNLSNTVGGSGRVVSYESILLGPVILDPVTGLPTITVDEDGEVEIERGEALVEVGSAAQSSRTSFLMETLFNQELRSDRTLPAGGTDHSAMLNTSEKRLVAEWIDLGAQYINDPFEDTNSNGVKELSEIRNRAPMLDSTVFENAVQPILTARCASCHQPFSGGLPGTGVNPGFETNRFILTGNTEGDYNVTLTMVNNTCQPDQSYLLSRPVSTEIDTPPHPRIDDPTVVDDPVNPTADDVAVMTAGEADYNTISSWIAAGCI